MEERVALLELQVSDLEENVIDLDEDVDFLFDEQVIQDERIFSLEQTSIDITADVESNFTRRLIAVREFMTFSLNIQWNVSVDTLFTGLQDTTLALDFRVTVLEENGGDDGNSSVAELEVRVETLEGTTANHETRISGAEQNIDGKALQRIHCVLS